MFNFGKIIERERIRGWCEECGIAWPPVIKDGSWLCPRCGGKMKQRSELKRNEKSAFAFQAWLDEVWCDGKWGPSPGGAATDLRCDRSMIDKLCDRGILEKSSYKHDGQLIVMISTRSIEKAKENKAKRGKWTDSGED
jgi:predicted RNA-binding Zn-ribbon protein involved in translation (DUF1610 family)